MEAPEISESTPLLRSPSISLPCIRPVIDCLLVQSNTTPTADHILAQFPSHRDFSPSYRTAFILITLLQIGSDARKQLARDDSLNLWDTWDHHVDAELIAEHCASHILEVWSIFLRVPRNNADLDALLWTVFPLGEDRCTGVCLANLLCQNFGEGLLIHPLILSTVSRTWKIKSLGTPRILHLMNLLMLFMYLITLVHYVMYPLKTASSGDRSFGPQGAYVVIYSLATILDEPATCLPFFFVFLCFVVSWAPVPGETLYTLTLLAILLNIFQLHLPYPSSPIHLLPPRDILPLSTFLLDGFTTISLPVILFFAPLLIISSYLLSSALADVFPTINLKPAPMEARAMFLSFSGFALLLTISSLAFAILSSGQLAQGNSGPADRWDRYSLRVGLESRRIFIRTVAKYSSPSYFPVPFNLLSLVLVRIPQILVLLFRRSEWTTSFKKLETALWSVLVLPLSCILGGFWLWGYV
ncbi:hypothetical protein BDM02DRAFT_3182136 [Thelephora ganbajun]|uniref:Uncharacterized protein n=1 Tax=Thelephora ganbajun TaxID=370292 RepID=A0ACB6ZY10_THEGA|nr:hypothetical protein BDM02DRAFT_3182136 [Thelephora ganbajun]